MGVKKYLVPSASPKSTNVNSFLKRAVGLTLSSEGDQPTKSLSATNKLALVKGQANWSWPNNMETFVMKRLAAVVSMVFLAGCLNSITMKITA